MSEELSISQKGYSALALASYLGRSECVRVLIENGADLELPNEVSSLIKCSSDDSLLLLIRTDSHPSNWLLKIVIGK